MDTRPTAANGMVPSCAKIGFACGKATTADLDHHADDAIVGPIVTRRLPPGLGARRPMSVQQMQIAQQAKLINAKKLFVRSHVPVRGVRAGATAISTVKKLRTLKKPPDRPPIAKPLKPLVLAPEAEAASSTETPPPVPVEERAIVPWVEIVPAHVPSPVPPRRTRPNAKSRFNPNAPYLSRGPRLERREPALECLHRLRTNVALPLPLEAILGSVWDGVQGSTPLMDGAETATSSACDPGLHEAPFATTARAARDPAHLDTPYTNSAHMPPDATHSPSLRSRLESFAARWLMCLLL